MIPNVRRSWAVNTPYTFLQNYIYDLTTNYEAVTATSIIQFCPFQETLVDAKYLQFFSLELLCQKKPGYCLE